MYMIKKSRENLNTFYFSFLKGFHSSKKQNKLFLEGESPTSIVACAYKRSRGKCRGLFKSHFRVSNKLVTLALHSFTNVFVWFLIVYSSRGSQKNL